MEDIFAFRNIQLIEDGQLIPDALLVVAGDRIRYAGPEIFAPDLSGIKVMDGGGQWLAPGYIDLQLNGGFGYDFTANPGAILEVAQRLPQTGVVAFLPTFITSPIDAYPLMLEAVSAAQATQFQNRHSGARVLGAHVEGPFLSPQKKGAHNQDLFRQANLEALSSLQPIEVVRLLTLAPEMPGGLDAIRWLVARGIIVSIGHSAADETEILAAISAGASYATHLYNAMGSMSHRDPGSVGTLLTEDNIICGLIVDGIHVHPRMVKLAYRSLGAMRLTLVTDAMAAMGMPPGEYGIGDQRVIVADATARLADGTLAGSILRLDEAVRNMVAYSGCPPAEAVRMASTTPAELLQMDRETGHLRPGYRADLILLDEGLNILETYIGGRRV